MSDSGTGPALEPGENELRGGLARTLGRNAFPASRDSLAAALSAQQAPPELAEAIGRLPVGQQFASLQDLLEALNLSPETGR